MSERKQLYRDLENSIVGGVCSGVAEYFNMDPNLVRIIYVLLSVISAGFPGVLVYLICWAVIPAKRIFY